jgi:RES domain-containing protein
LIVEGLILSQSFFRTRKPATLYRIAKAKYANLSGVGAARYPGRWNFPGQEAIYTSTEVGVAILETLAHLRKDLIPSGLVIMTISVSGDWVDSEERSRRSNYKWLLLPL